VGPKYVVLGIQVLFHYVVIELHSRPGLSGTVMKPLLTMGFSTPSTRSLHQGTIHGVILQHEEVFGGGGYVNVSHAGDGRSREVHGHGHAVFLNGIADLVGFKNAPSRRQIRMQDVSRVHRRQLDENSL